MIFVPSVIALFVVAFIRQPTPVESLKCYQFSVDHVVDCAGQCLSYLRENGNGTMIERCCSDNCKTEGSQKIHSCSKDRCNGAHSDRKLLAINQISPSRRIIRKRTSEELSASLSCYECSTHNPQCGIDEATITKGCRACVVFRNVYDNNNVNRRCCLSGCGESDTIGEYDGRTAYFCGSDLCNGIGSEDELGIVEESSTTMIASSTTPIVPTTTVQTISQCYDCSGPECGKPGSSVTTNCPSCMVYRNPNDQTKIERHCCWWACGAPNTVSTYSGAETYFCVGDKCNGESVDSMLSPPVLTTTVSSAVTTAQQTVSRCYECSGPQCGEGGASLSGNCPSCMLYRNPEDQTKIERRCCWWACGSPNTVGMYNGMETYFCVGDECNGYGAESTLSPPITTTTTVTLSSTIIVPTTTRQTSFQCYQCSGSDCGKDISTISGNCPSCMAYRNPDDQTQIERRCCWTNCGPSNSVKLYEGMETYFCTGDGCNGYGVEFALSPAVTTTTATQMTTVTLSSTIAMSTTTRQTSFQCYQCSGPDCGKDRSTISGNCPSCMAYRNPSDQTQIERRCCWWNCGPSNSVGMYEGVETYFCNGDGCNGYGVEFALSPPVITTTSSAVTTPVTITATSSSTVTMSTTTRQTSFQCYQCSGPDCGKDRSTISGNCPSCMAYRNPSDQTQIERRCCWTNCGPSNTVKIYEGMETYFCTGDGCNGYGVEFALSPPVTTTTRITTTTMSSIASTPITTTATQMTTVTLSSTTATPTTTRQMASQCYQCSGPDCGKDPSTISGACPSCMAYRNPSDQTKIERRCCWWNCGPSNSVGMYDGVETYFCTGDGCNGYGVESALSPPVTTTTTTTASTMTVPITTTTGMTTSTSSAGTCVLNCQNGGTPETTQGCFCYCLDNTYGRECENIACFQPDADSSICIAENQPLCDESENFAFDCHHLCGKC